MIFFKKTRLNRIKTCLFCLYFGTKKISFFCLYFGTEGVFFIGLNQGGPHILEMGST